MTDNYGSMAQLLSLTERTFPLNDHKISNRTIDSHRQNGLFSRFFFLSSYAIVASVRHSLCRSSILYDKPGHFTVTRSTTRSNNRFDSEVILFHNILATTCEKCCSLYIMNGGAITWHRNVYRPLASWKTFSPLPQDSLSALLQISAAEICSKRRRKLRERKKSDMIQKFDLIVAEMQENRNWQTQDPTRAYQFT